MNTKVTLKSIALLILFLTPLFSQEQADSIIVKYQGKTAGARIISISAEGKWKSKSVDSKGEVQSDRLGKINPLLLSLLYDKLEKIGYFNIQQKQLEEKEKSLGGNKETEIDAWEITVTINRKEGSHEFSGSSLNSISSRRLADEYKTVEMAWKYIVAIIELTHRKAEL